MAADAAARTRAASRSGRPRRTSAGNLASARQPGGAGRGPGCARLALASPRPYLVRRSVYAAAAISNRPGVAAVGPVRVGRGGDAAPPGPDVVVAQVGGWIEPEHGERVGGHGCGPGPKAASSTGLMSGSARTAATAAAWSGPARCRSGRAGTAAGAATSRLTWT